MERHFSNTHSARLLGSRSLEESMCQQLAYRPPHRRRDGATQETPKITASPFQVCQITRRELGKCPDVSTITIRDWMQNIITDDEQVNSLVFNALPEAGAAPRQPDSPPMGSSFTMTNQATSGSSMSGSSIANQAPPSNFQDVKNTLDDMRQHVDALSVNFSRDIVQLETKLSSKYEEVLSDGPIAQVLRGVAKDIKAVHDIAKELKASQANQSTVNAQLATSADDTLSVDSSAVAIETPKRSSVQHPATAVRSKKVRK